MNKFLTLVGYVFFLAVAIPLLPGAVGMYLHSEYDIPNIDMNSPFPLIGYVSLLFVLSLGWLFLLVEFLVQVANSFSGM
jgi:hypothetical protein